MKQEEETQKPGEGDGSITADEALNLEGNDE